MKLCIYKLTTISLTASHCIFGHLIPPRPQLLLCDLSVLRFHSLLSVPYIALFHLLVSGPLLDFLGALDCSLCRGLNVVSVGVARVSEVEVALRGALPRGIVLPDRSGADHLDQSVLFDLAEMGPLVFEHDDVSGITNLVLIVDMRLCVLPIAPHGVPQLSRFPLSGLIPFGGSNRPCSFLNEFGDSKSTNIALIDRDSIIMRSKSIDSTLSNDNKMGIQNSGSLLGSARNHSSNEIAVAVRFDRRNMARDPPISQPVQRRNRCLEIMLSSFAVHLNHVLFPALFHEGIHSFECHSENI